MSPIQYRSTTPADAARPSRWWNGKRVMLNRMHYTWPRNIAAGTEAVAVRKWMGLVLRLDACPCCGHVVILRGVEFKHVLIEKGVGDRAPVG